MTGAGTIDLGTKQIGFRVEPKLVMTTEGQGRTGDPVGFGIPVMIEGPWDAPRIYPEMPGHSGQSRRRLCQAARDGQGPVRAERRRPGRLGRADQWRRPGRRHGPGAGGAQPGGASGQAGSLLGGQLGETIGNLLQQGLSGGLGQQGGAGAARPSHGNQPGSQQGPQPVAGRAGPTARPRAPAQADSAEPQDSQPMNEVLRQLFNR